MSIQYDMILRGGEVFTTEGLVQTDVGVLGGRIRSIGNLSGASSHNEVDVTGLTVLPGVIDSQVHFREPGLEHKEDLASGTHAAVMGGVTAIFEMPNTSPPTDTAAALTDKVTRALGRAWCDFAFFAGATTENAKNLKDLEVLPGCAGVKVFIGSSTGNLLVADDKNLAKVLASGRRRVAAHCEDEERLQERMHLIKGGNVPPAMHAEWRDAKTALKATQRLLRLAEQNGRRVHVLHISTADEMEFLRDWKHLATVEVLPQHLTLAAPDCYDALGTYAQMNPPIRDASHRDGIWKALNAGLVDCIGSDHAPHTKEEKDRGYPNSPAGMPGVQTLVPIMLGHVAKGRLSLQRFVDLTSAGPARVYGVARKGRIALGYDGDFTVVDLKAKRTITAGWCVYKCGWTPYDGVGVTGWPIMTIIRGQVVMREDELQGSPVGVPVQFQECL